MKLPKMKRPSRRVAGYLVLAVCSFVVFFIAGLPAQLGYRMLVQPAQRGVVQLDGLQGTLWHGQANRARIANLNLGKLEWDVHPLPLLTGRVSADLMFRNGEGHGKGHISSTFTGTVTVSETKVEIPAQSLMALAYGLPVALGGNLSLDIKQAIIKRGETLQLDGRLNWLNAATVAPQQLPLGNLSLLSTVKDDGSQASLTQVEGNLYNIDGELQVKGNGQYKVTGTLAVKDPSRQDLKAALYLIGRPRPDGAAEVLLTGRLPGW